MNGTFQPGTDSEGGLCGMKHVANGAGGIVCSHHRGDRRDPISARLDHLSRIRGGDSSDAQDRQPDVPSDLTESLEADGRSIGRFGWGKEQRA